MMFAVSISLGASSAHTVVSQITSAGAGSAGPPQLSAPRLVFNTDGQHSTPIAAAFTEHETLFGSHALNYYARQPGAVVPCVFSYAAAAAAVSEERPHSPSSAAAQKNTHDDPVAASSTNVAKGSENKHATHNDTTNADDAAHTCTHGSNEHVDADETHAHAANVEAAEASVRAAAAFALKAVRAACRRKYAQHCPLQPPIIPDAEYDDSLLSGDDHRSGASRRTSASSSWGYRYTQNYPTESAPVDKFISAEDLFVLFLSYLKAHVIDGACNLNSGGNGNNAVTGVGSAGQVSSSSSASAAATRRRCIVLTLVVPRHLFPRALLRRGAASRRAALRWLHAAVYQSTLKESLAHVSIVFSDEAALSAWDDGHTSGSLTLPRTRAVMTDSFNESVAQSTHGTCDKATAEVRDSQTHTHTKAHASSPSSSSSPVNASVRCENGNVLVMDWGAQSVSLSLLRVRGGALVVDAEMARSAAHRINADEPSVGTSEETGLAQQQQQQQQRLLLRPRPPSFLCAAALPCNSADLDVWPSYFARSIGGVGGDAMDTALAERIAAGFVAQHRRCFPASVTQPALLNRLGRRPLPAADGGRGAKEGDNGNEDGGCALDGVLPARAMRKLRLLMGEKKMALSTMSQTANMSVELEAFYEGMDLHDTTSLNRNKLDAAVRSEWGLAEMVDTLLTEFTQRMQQLSDEVAVCGRHADAVNKGSDAPAAVQDADMQRLYETNTRADEPPPGGAWADSAGCDSPLSCLPITHIMLMGGVCQMSSIVDVIHQCLRRRRGVPASPTDADASCRRRPSSIFAESLCFVEPKHGSSETCAAFGGCHVSCQVALCMGRRSFLRRLCARARRQHKKADLSALQGLLRAHDAGCRALRGDEMKESIIMTATEYSHVTAAALLPHDVYVYTGSAVEKALLSSHSALPNSATNAVHHGRVDWAPHVVPIMSQHTPLPHRVCTAVRRGEGETFGPETGSWVVYLLTSEKESDSSLERAVVGAAGETESGDVVSAARGGGRWRVLNPGGTELKVVAPAEHAETTTTTTTTWFYFLVWTACVQQEEERRATGTESEERNARAVMTVQLVRHATPHPPAMLTPAHTLATAQVYLS